MQRRAEGTQGDKFMAGEYDEVCRSLIDLLAIAKVAIPKAGLASPAGNPPPQRSQRPRGPCRRMGGGAA